MSTTVQAPTQDLEAQLSAGSLVTDRDVIDAYSSDKALFCPAGQALALVRARSVDDVVAVMAFATEHRVPVVTQGARTGLSGAANAIDGCLLLNVAAMDEIVAIDPVNQTCRVQPGVINQDLKAALAEHALSYPPDPGSVAISTIGGNVATNAGGMCCVKYGVTKDYVRAMTVVLADGTVTKLGTATAKGVAGLDLAALLVGSEGTLGTIVEVTLALKPALPPPITAVGIFPDTASAGRTVTEYMGSGAAPSLLELIDGPSVAMINAYGDFGLPDDVGALLLVQSNASGAGAVEELEAFQRIAEANGGTEVFVSDDPADSELLVAARRAVAPAMEKYANERGGGELVDDVCVPRSALGDFFEKLRAIATEFDVEIATAGHAGDGNMHPSVIFDAGDESQVAQAQEAFAAIMQLGLDLGGTITGEHGVGFLKREWLGHELDAGATLMHQKIKEALDPLSILNPGKMFG
ncbi:MAG: FAD-binding protein [Brevibacterium sp.]|uniref:FAD-binding oxidoreductase n=1 Tax=Brevibacterium sandarakinum TaxID=629680 RepID=UPI00264ACCB4|nr:FAD-linked oxidase C-terminal domain-containing protein [Brevibacterium sandarakinum]MDN5586201.1 FAD-binding protein [Brevibacterium sp.]MDN5657772.1 FAD-binding protein [Brevibacterium sandarakinum]